MRSPYEPERDQRLAHVSARGVSGVVGHLRARHHDAAGAEVERELHHLAEVVDARLEVFGQVEPAAERHVQGREVLAERAEEVAELAAPGLAEPVRGEVADGVDLHARGGHLAASAMACRSGNPVDSSDDPDAEGFMQ